MKRSIAIIGGLMLLSGYAIGQNNKAIYSSKAYTVYPDRVVQGKYTAKATSVTSLTSDYSSPANMFKSPVIEFKFSINGKDNEMTAGVNHHFTCLTQNNETPVIKFGGADAVQTFEAKAKMLLEQANAHRHLSSSLSFDDA